MEETLKLRSGATIGLLKKSDPDFRKYLTRTTLSQLHLQPGGDPVAFTYSPDSEDIVFYFDPLFVKEAPPDGVDRRGVQAAGGSAVGVGIIPG